MKLFTTLIGLLYSVMISASSDPIGLLELSREKLKDENLKSIEFDYEVVGAPVLERKGAEFRLLKIDGSSVLMSFPTGKFHGFKDLFNRDKMFRVRSNISFFMEAGGLAITRKPSRITREILGLYELGNRPMPVYAKPEKGSKLLRNISNLNPWVARLEGSCPCGILISERRGPWLRLSDIRGDRNELLADEGWLFADMNTKITPITSSKQEEAQSLVYKSLLDEVPVKLRDTKVVDGKLWAKVELDLEGRCGKNPEELGMIPEKIFWIRVFSEEATPQVWYSPRGC